MNINKLVQDVLSEAALELLDTLAAHTIVASPQQRSSLTLMPVEADNWNPTMMLMREIFEAEILVSGETEWLGFRILQAYGVRDGQLAYQFTPVFAQALSA
ncbi:hypothetical protein RY831_25095 [Noviherbaspirillum sp. CPCC 100848]|uniref:Uncharacterized protein n=1 Tax=Noviherbaspirillum album TaxID=3080276 RepID=A0ABU6JFY6_9BURK|nr:hypothetical protein [Noviherbaspirillum sp. CPCC 100848]MEC4722445.1 hypothetical protein [Noviherbaspirillum sp. CPCC 100848]